MVGTTIFHAEEAIGNDAATQFAHAFKVMADLKQVLFIRLIVNVILRHLGNVHEDRVDKGLAQMFMQDPDMVSI